MGQDAIYPSVAVDPAGTATAVWARFDGTRYIAQSSTRTAPGGLWSAPVNLSHTLLSVSNTHVATSSSGRVVATWSAEPDGAPCRVQAAIRAPGAAWGPGVDLSDTTADAIQPRLVVAADGAATVVWNWFNGAVDDVQGASAPAGAAFGAAVTLSSDPRTRSSHASQSTPTATSPSSGRTSDRSTTEPTTARTTSPGRRSAASRPRPRHRREGFVLLGVRDRHLVVGGVVRLVLR